MSRPTDWSPLCESDPVPGDPHAVREEAKRLGDIGDTLEEQARKLRKIGKDDTLKGKYVGRLHDESEKLADKFDKTKGRYKKVSSALHGWASDLEEAQRVAGKARQHAKHHEKDDDEVDEAQKRLSDAMVTYQQQGQKVVRKIDEAIDDDVEDSLWDDIDAWVDEHADAIKTVVEALSWAGTILAAVALIWTLPGVLAVLAVGLAVAVLAGNTLLASTGNGSWGSVALSAISLATVGTGAAATKAISGIRAGTKTAAVKASGKATERGTRQALRGKQDKLAQTMQNSRKGSAKFNAASRKMTKLRRDYKDARNYGMAQEMKRDMQVASRRQSVTVGGNHTVSDSYKDVQHMKQLYPNDPGVQAASRGVEGARKVSQAGWGTATTIDLGAKGMGGSNIFDYPAYGPYQDTMGKFKQEQGSYWQ